MLTQSPKGLGKPKQAANLNKNMPRHRDLFESHKCDNKKCERTRKKHKPRFVKRSTECEQPDLGKKKSGKKRLKGLSFFLGNYF